ncbi:hypothetical protein LAG90_09115 [Marinilongibacter aquaticus]|uniref:hypothetical protein n=1 Tax=Marinilongibacter aquaticus TaxID=2975157 RepID=UPI0021BD403B|nr:hypothetical protein [Marinilongibacter aquaticus]UBM60794.1 hypothetical protein LAG90_09115 [Marinilongibacter aquaticus]
MKAIKTSRKEELRQQVDALLKSSKEVVDEAKKYIVANGGTVDLDEYITLKRYCQRFDIPNIQTVTNWISRGVIPPENIKVIEELNGLKLIKAVPYK